MEKVNVVRMKKGLKNVFGYLIFFVVLLVASVFRSNAQQGVWIWMHGDSTTTIAVYGVQGISSPQVKPSPVYQGPCWTGHDDKFWLYGPNDNLWKYDPAINQWTWVRGVGNAWSTPVYGTQGIPTPSNTPGPRTLGTLTWTDTTGNLWLFGGSAGMGFNADLWKYDVASNMWTWVSGSNAPNAPGVYGTQGLASAANYPPSRAETNASWVHAPTNTLWLYGGQSYSSLDSLYSDLWSYDIASNTWTWVNGSNVLGAPPVFGALGVPSSSNHPGARCVYSKWTDEYNNFWLMGAGSPTNSRNDLWKYNPSSNEWTWMSGSTNFNTPCVAASVCSYDMQNSPPGNTFEQKASWADSKGNLWTFSLDPNLLWKFNPDSNRWLLPRGNCTNIPFHQGVMGVPDSSNWPASNNGTSSWIDANDNLWMYVAANGGSYLWKYIPDTTCDGGPESFLLPNATIEPLVTKVCPDSCIAFGNGSTNASSFEWFFDGATPGYSTDQYPTNICYATSGSYNVTLVVHNGPYSDTSVINNLIQVYTAPSPVITQSNDTLFCSDGITYQWYYNNAPIAGANNAYYVPTANGLYTVEATGAHGCSRTAEYNVLNVSVEEVATALAFEVYPNPADEMLTVKYNGHATLRLYNTLGQEVYEREFSSGHTIDMSLLPAGMFCIAIQADGSVGIQTLVVSHR
jgi:hypothetical protein